MNQTTFLQRAALGNAVYIKRAALLCAIWLLASLAISYKQIIHPEFGLTGDVSLHYHVTRAFARSFDEGDLLPRWAGLLDGGNGDALFTFYPPLFYLFSVVLMKISGVGILTSLKITSFLILFIAQTNAYLFARAFFNRRYSLVSSLLYAALPAFPFILLNRGFLPNAFALSLAPLAMLGARELLVGERRARGLIIFALGLSGVILSHTITTYLCGIAIALMALVYLPRAGLRGVARLAASGLLVFALTAFFLVPQQIEMKWVRVDLQAARHDYRNYFLFAKPQDASRYRQDWSEINNVMSYATLAQTALASLFFLAGWPALRGRNRMTAPVVLGLAFAAFALIISLPWSDVIWRSLPGLRFIQFPWRFLPFVSLGCGLIVAAARAPRENNQSGWQMLKPIHRAIISFLLTWVVIANIFLTWLVVRAHEPEITGEQVIKLIDSPDAKKFSFEETERLQSEDKNLFKAYTSNHYYYRPRNAELEIYPPASQPGGLAFLSGRGRVRSQTLNNESREFVIECEEPSRAKVDTYRYPHWVARLDGREINIDVESGTGLMLIDLPRGRHELKITFEPRHQIEMWAWRVSLLGWALFIGWMVIKVFSFQFSVFRKLKTEN